MGFVFAFLLVAVLAGTVLLAVHYGPAAGCLVALAVLVAALVWLASILLVFLGVGRSAAPSDATWYPNSVWVSKAGYRARDAYSSRDWYAKAPVLGYAETASKLICQQASGAALLRFDRVGGILAMGVRPACDRKAAASRASTDGISATWLRRSKATDNCQAAWKNLFKKEPPVECFDIEARIPWQARYFLNCSQDYFEYTLRAWQPNALVGGENLQPFAGVNFSGGSCLDAAHESLVGILLDVIGLGDGNATYEGLASDTR